MKTIRLAAAAFVALSAAALAQSEGVAEFRGSMGVGRGPSLTSSGKVYFTKSAYRLEWEVNLSALAERKWNVPEGVLPKRSRMVIIQKQSDLDLNIHLNDDRRTYVMTDVKQLREEAARLPHPTTYTVEKLGNDTVAGVPCLQALVKSSRGTTVEMCVATGLTAASSWIEAMNRRDSSDNLFKALREKGLVGFPVRLVTRSRSKSEPSLTIELVRFDKKALPPSLFEIPAGYTPASEYLNLTPEQEQMLRESRQKKGPQRVR